MSAQGWTAVPHSVARSTTLSVNAKVVYLVLASRANADGVAWPSRKTLATDAGISLASVERALPELRDAGAISWERTTADDGTPCGASRYRIAPQGVPHTEAPLPHTEVPPASERGTPTSQGGTGVPHTEVRRTTSRRTPKKNTDAHAHSAHFDTFWQTYPIKVGKGRARLAYDKALKTTDPATLLTAVERFTAETAATERRFIPHPTTWLNAERWTDEPAAQPPRPAGSSIWDKPIRPYEEDIA